MEFLCIYIYIKAPVTSIKSKEEKREPEFKKWECVWNESVNWNAFEYLHDKQHMDEIGPGRDMTCMDESLWLEMCQGEKASARVKEVPR